MTSVPPSYNQQKHISRFILGMNGAFARLVLFVATTIVTAVVWLAVCEEVRHLWHFHTTEQYPVIVAHRTEEV